MKNLIDLVDFHAHILPSADHGSDSLQTTKKQLDYAFTAGVKRVIATPHFYPTHHEVESFVERRNSSYRELLSANSEVDVRLGAEVLICNSIDSLPGLEKLFIHGTNSLLLELPFSDFQSEYCDCVYNLTLKGIEVIVAHADRYSPVNIEKLIDVGAKLQLNADSFSGLFVKRHLYDWVNRELVVALGSDIHGNDKKAYKSFALAKSKLGDALAFIKKESDRIFNSALRI